MSEFENKENTATTNLAHNNPSPPTVDHPRTIISNLPVVMLDEVLMNKIPADSTVVVINSVMAALDETESLQKARKVMANRQAFIQRLYDYKIDQLSLAKCKTLKTYISKPAYKKSEVEKTRSAGTV